MADDLLMEHELQQASEVQLFMRLNGFPLVLRRAKAQGGFTLVEVVTAVAIVALVMGATLSAYIQTARRAEWTGMSLAAQGFAIQQLEQARSAFWQEGVENNITNLNLLSKTYNSGAKEWKGYTWADLDLPVSTNGTTVRATNHVIIKEIPISARPNAKLIHMVKVDTVWPFTGWGKVKYFTNTIATYIAPD